MNLTINIRPLRPIRPAKVWADKAEKVVHRVKVGDKVFCRTFCVGRHSHSVCRIDGCNGLLVVKKVDEFRNKGLVDWAPPTEVYEVVAGRGTTFQVVETQGLKVLNCETYFVEW